MSEVDEKDKEEKEFEVTIQKELGRSLMQVVKKHTITVSEIEIEMLKNRIDGVLPVTVRYVDQLAVFCYEITKKVPWVEEIRHRSIDVAYITLRIHQILEVLKEAKNYLLEEHNFVINLEQSYVSENGISLWLCYLPGYHREVMEQMAELFEQFMKQIDYGNQLVVQLVYQLYGISKEKNNSYEQLLEPLGYYEEASEPPNYLTEETKYYGQAQESINEGRKESGEFTEKQIPVMAERLLQEQEVLNYPKFYYGIFAGTVMGSVIAMVALLKTSILKNAYTGQLDLIKVVVSIVLFAAIVAYVGRSMFQEKNKISRTQIKPLLVTYEGKEIGTTTEEMGGNQRKVENERKQISQMTYDKSRHIGVSEMSNSSLLQDGNDNNRGSKEMPTQLLSAGETPTRLLTPSMHLTLVSETRSAGQLVIDKSEAVIGSNGATVDYLVSNPAVSREHARVFVQQGSYWIKDLHSTNGTFYNGNRLLDQEMVQLKEGDQITLADERYLVHY